MTELTKPTPSPRRVAAGRRNQMLSKGITPEGREKLRETAFRNKPWLHSTGPRSAEGKRRAAMNGKRKQLGPKSVREVQCEIAELRGLLAQLRESRRMVLGLGDD